MDFVVTWVDSSDPKWRADFEITKEKKDGCGDFSAPRFRDWDNLKYWFRGVERYAPWVRKVHLVTSGHYPEWLNLSCDKLNIVRHEDYIDPQYLPTFNSRVIENNLHKIESLAEKFVLFNDDFFIIDKMDPKDFFKNDLPCDCAILNASSGDGISYILMNNLSLINKVFDKNTVITENFLKWFNLRYGKSILRTILLLAWPRFTGFYEPHAPQSYLKSTFVKCWALYGEELENTNKSNFRLHSDVNHYLFRYFQLVTGRFSPMNRASKSMMFQAADHNYLDIVDAVILNKKPIIVINDDDSIRNFYAVRSAVNGALEKKLQVKSQFEK
ncbi:Stealth CR1 domain-containing protein [Zhongshania sp.]|uniref:Stealth CR1 domain-containing protein n=1 Tax=Zhongshania sp. TaxID=1971902 RepID=UPI0035693EA5